MPSVFKVASLTSLLILTASVSAQAIHPKNVEGPSAVQLVQLDKGGAGRNAEPKQAPSQKGDRGSRANRGGTTVREGRSGSDGASTRRRSGGDGVTVRRRGDQAGGSTRAYRRADRGNRRGVRFYWGPGAEFWFYDGYYHGDCTWLRRKARATGSRYWWTRYRQCRAL